MRKWIVFLMLCLCLCGCRQPKPQNSFFSQETLQSMALQDLPVPDQATDCLLVKESKVYLQLSQEEYVAYAQTLLNYLQQRQDVLFLSYPHSQLSDLWFFFYDVLAPIRPDYDPAAPSHTFVFSTQSQLSANGRLQDAVRILLFREENTYDRREFNTVLVLGTEGGAYDPCAAVHTPDEGISYPVAGTGEMVTIRTCIHCGAKLRDPDYGNGGTHPITVAEGGEYLMETVGDSGYSGQFLEIRLRVCPDSDLIVTVNGEVIPKSYYGSDYWGYGFIVPSAKMEIRIFPAEGGPIPPSEDSTYLFFYESWLRQLHTEQIIQVTTIARPLAVPEDCLSVVQHTTDPAAISTYWKSWSLMTMTRLTGEDALMPAGGSALIVQFHLADGSVYSMAFSNQRFYDPNGDVYELNSLPSLSAFVNVTEAWQFVTALTQCAVLDTEGKPIGTLSDLSALEFTDYAGEQLQLQQALYQISCGFGRIYVLSETVFCLENSRGVQAWYELSGSTFSQWIQWEKNLPG